ncbi:lysophospholipase [Fretibacter rubidus]|uniref:alpha/beta hydrolase n=1 Tax=Fretibacter rubidus TaxID=570162 RepID=UPI00352A50CE
METLSLTSRDGTALHGVILAAPDNPKAVMTLIHGFGEHSARYQAMADVLAMSGIAVISGDLRGHGQSDGKRGSVNSYQDLRDDLDAILTATRARFSGVPHVLYGHSMGGGLVLHHLLDSPEVGHDLYSVIASAPLLALKSPPGKLAEMAVRGLSKIAPGLVIKSPIDGTKISTLPAEQSAYVNDPLTHGSMNARLAVGMVEAGQAASAAASNWNIPLLLMHAQDDRLTDVTASMDFAAQAKQCQFHAFDNVEHEMHNDSCREAVYTLMRDFILETTKTKQKRLTP